MEFQVGDRVRIVHGKHTRGGFRPTGEVLQISGHALKVLLDASGRSVRAAADELIPLQERSPSWSTGRI